MESEPTAVYRPSRPFALFAGGLFLVTAAVLAWLGAILGPEDREAIGGFYQLIFTIIPIRPFAWVFAAVFAVFGVRLFRRGIVHQPTLTVTSEGLVVGDGRVRPWSDLLEMSVPADDRLVLRFAGDTDAIEKAGKAPSARKAGRARTTRKARRGEVVLSQFDLGADPAEVMKHLERWRGVG